MGSCCQGVPHSAGTAYNGYHHPNSSLMPSAAHTCTRMLLGCCQQRPPHLPPNQASSWIGLHNAAVCTATRCPATLSPPSEIPPPPHNLCHVPPMPSTCQQPFGRPTNPSNPLP